MAAGMFGNLFGKQKNILCGPTFDHSQMMTAMILPHTLTLTHTHTHRPSISSQTR